MKEMDRRDFMKTTGTIAGAVALSGIPGVLRARTKTAVAVVKSDMDVAAGFNFDMSVWGDDTAKSRQRLGLMELTWTPESMAEVEKMVRKAVKLAGGLPVKRGDKVCFRRFLRSQNLMQGLPSLGSFLSEYPDYELLFLHIDDIIGTVEDDTTGSTGEAADTHSH